MKITSYDELLFRCSSLSYLFTNPQGKTPAEKLSILKEEVAVLEADIKAAFAAGKMELKTNKAKLEKLAAKQLEIINLEKKKDDVALMLSETTKNHLTDIYISVKYGRRTELHNKYIKKGLMTEEDGITAISSYFGKFFTKNNERKSNGFITGEADIVEGDGAMRNDAIYDNKSSWDVFTFFRHRNETEPDKKYYLQMQGYGILWGAEDLHLCYTLINTPEPIIEGELKNLWYKMGQPVDDNPVWVEAVAEMRKKMVYDDIPEKEKVIVQSFKTDFSLESEIETRVKLGREFLKQYYPL